MAMESCCWLLLFLRPAAAFPLAVAVAVALAAAAGAGAVAVVVLGTVSHSAHTRADRWKARREKHFCQTPLPQLLTHLS